MAHFTFFRYNGSNDVFVRYVRSTATWFAFLAPALAQQAVPQVSPGWDRLNSGFNVTLPGCDSSELQAARSLTLRERACFYSRQFAGSGTLFGAALSSGFSQWRNSPYQFQQDLDDYGRRLSILYGRRAARYTGELVAGYFDREDPRYHPSHENGGWNRTRAALRSVLLTESAGGETRMALAPVAGAFGSGFGCMPCYGAHDGIGDAFRRTGTSYSAYFIRAVLHEFHPEFATLASRVRAKRK